MSLCGGERAKRIAGRRHAAGGRRQVAAGSRRRQRAAHGRTAAPGGGSSGPGRVNAAAPAASPRPRVGLGISIGSSHGCRDASAAAACGSRLASRTTNRRSPRRALAKNPSRVAFTRWTDAARRASRPKAHVCAIEVDMDRDNSTPLYCEWLSGVVSSTIEPIDVLRGTLGF